MHSSELYISCFFFLSEIIFYFMHTFSMLERNLVVQAKIKENFSILAFFKKKIFSFIFSVERNDPALVFCLAPPPPHPESFSAFLSLLLCPRRMTFTGCIYRFLSHKVHSAPIRKTDWGEKQKSQYSEGTTA